MIKLLVKKILKIFVSIIDKFFPSAFDNALDRFIVHKIDNKNIYFLNLGSKSRNRSNQAFYKEPDTMRWIDSFEKNSTFMDIGSNIGAFSIYAAVKRNCTVYSFEPSLNANYIFLINIAKNKLKNLVSLYPVLLSDYKDHQFFETNIPNDTLDNLSGFNFLNEGSHEINSESPLSHVNYFVASLNFEDLHFNKDINHLKIDVDGNEKQVLQTCSLILKQNSLQSIMIELDVSDKHYLEIIGLLENNGYKICDDYQDLTKASAKRSFQRYNHFFKKIYH